MDKMLRAEIIGEVRRAMKESLEMYQEQWVSGDELCKQMNFFSRSWLRSYGHTLPREQVVVTDDKPHRTGWCYPLHRIQRMLQSGELKALRV